MRKIRTLLLFALISSACTSCLGPIHELLVEGGGGRQVIFGILNGSIWPVPMHHFQNELS
jgi:hypothetical protein